MILYSSAATLQDWLTQLGDVGTELLLLGLTLCSRGTFWHKKNGHSQNHTRTPP